MSPPLIGIITTVLFLCLLLFKMPIALAMALSGVLGYTYIVNLKAALRILSSDIFTTFNSYSLSVIPMFILMGFIAHRAGVGERLYAFAYKIIGRLPGGLAITSVFACAVFGAICGSSSATAATIGAIAIPEMKKYKYSDSLSAGSVASGEPWGC